jgi:predicted aspartyl protease
VLTTALPLLLLLAADPPAASDPVVPGPVTPSTVAPPTVKPYIEVSPADEAPPPDPVPVVPLEELAVTAPEPRYVAPTNRDRIGRIWAPVSINGQGPFRLVLDTGASHSAVTAQVAEILGIPTDSKHTATLRGATGSVTVPLIPIESMEVGELLMLPQRLPIVPDALGGAEGVLGTDGLANKRIFIDFRRDNITIMRSRNERAAKGFVTVPVKFMRGRLLVINALLGGIKVKAIIDTGGQATLGNVALREALAERRRRQDAAARPDEVTGATLEVQMGNRISTPSIVMGDVVVRNAAMTFADFAIFEYWKMTEEPTMLIGMDVLGLLDTLVIDYRRKELQMKLRRG